MRLALATLALLPAQLALAADATPVDLSVGETVNVCKAGLATCPLQTSICDDPSVATIEIGKDGPELKAVAPGTTLCGLLGSSGYRRVLRVTVKGKDSP